MSRQHVTEVPQVKFEGRKIYIESFGYLDKDSLKLANSFGQILKEKFFDNQAIKEPRIITPL
jgi:hypothetical protein